MIKTEILEVILSVTQIALPLLVFASPAQQPVLILSIKKIHDHVMTFELQIQFTIVITSKDFLSLDVYDRSG